MFSPVTAVSYRAVLRSPGAPRAFVAATLGRLSYGTISLSLLFTAQRATGSFAAAGGVLAACGGMSLTMPIKSRLVDRYGQARMLTLLGVSYASILVGFCVLAVLGVDHAPVYVVLGGAAGVLAPPLGPAMRDLWAGLSVTSALRQRAYSLDAVVEESLYTLGPVLAGVLIALGGPVLALASTAVLLLLGSVGMATSSAARTHAAPGTDRAPGQLLGPLRQPGFRAVLAAILGIGLCLGLVDVGAAARAQHEGAAPVAGYLLAALSLGSVIGGLAWGRITHRHRRSSQLTGLLVVLAVGVGAAAWAPTLVVLAAVLAVTGLALAPVFIVSYLATDDLVPHTGRTEASTWINVANNVGAAGGSAAAGAIVDHAAASTCLVAGAVVLAAAIPVVLLSRRRVDRSRPADTPARRVPHGAKIDDVALRPAVASVFSRPRRSPPQHSCNRRRPAA